MWWFFFGYNFGLKKVWILSLYSDYKEKGFTQANLQKFTEEFRGHEVPLFEEWSHQPLHAQARKSRALNEDLIDGVYCLTKDKWLKNLIENTDFKVDKFQNMKKIISEPVVRL